MPRNGSGTYIPPASSWNPAEPDTTITSDDWNDLRDDMVVAISASIANDGQTTTSAAIPFTAGVLAGSGALATPGYSFIGDLDTGIYRPGANQISYVAGGVAGIVQTASGVSFPLNVTLGDGAGDTITVNGTTNFVVAPTLPAGSVTNATLADMATQTIKGRTTAGTGAPEDLTAAQAAAILPAVVGDSGSGGTKGLVPAPTAGQAALGLVLGAGGTFVAAIPAGAIAMFGMTTVPTGWLYCNGQAVSRTTYARLFTAIGTTFGAGDGTTTFALPDLRGYFPRGWDDARGVDTGRAFGSPQADDLKAHVHSVSPPAATDDTSSGLTTTGTGGAETITPYDTGSTGGTETRPVNIALVFCIKD
jgi:microcystin-dependent protein